MLHVREPVPGKTVQLTLDNRIQSLVQKEIAKTLRDWHAKAVTAVVLDTRTGGILAMAAAPGVPPQGYRAGNPTPSGACARSPTSTSPARRSSS